MLTKWKFELYALINTVLLIVIYNYGSPNSADYNLYIPWDGFIDINHFKIIDINTFRINGIGILLDFPEFIVHGFISNILNIFNIKNNQYFSRTFFIFISCYLISFISIKKVETKSLSSYILITSLILMLFTNISYQSLINDGVMYRLPLQCSYLLFCLIILYSHDVNSRNGFIRLSILSFILLIISCWTFSYILTLFIFYLIFIFPLLISNYKDYIKTPFFIHLIVINILFISIIYYIFYYFVQYNSFDVLNQYNNLNEIRSGATFNYMKGGLLYQASGMTDWSLYTNWGYRLFGLMDFKIDTHIFQTVTLIFFGIAIICANQIRYKIIFTSLLLIYLFLAKGNQIPFGSIYLYLVDNYTLFQSIRTPDTKLGVFFIALVILIILISYLNRKKYKLFILGLTFLYFTVSLPPLLDGATTFSGKDSYTSNHFYAINTAKDSDLISLITSLDSNKYSGVLLPGLGNIITKSGLIGFQDYLYQNTDFLLSYANATKGPYGDLLHKPGINDYNNSVENIKLWMKKRGIFYIVVRKSIERQDFFSVCFECLAQDKDLLPVFDDGLSTVYFLNSFSPETNASQMLETALESPIIKRLNILKYVVFFFSLFLISLNFIYYLYISTNNNRSHSIPDR